jgi:hypothetical protein
MASGARRRHLGFRQLTQSQGAAWRISSKVGGGMLEWRGTLVRFDGLGEP